MPLNSRPQPRFETRLEPVSTEEALRLVPHLAPGKAQTILVTGKRGFGKTVFTEGSPEHHVEGYIERCEPRVLVLDVHGDYNRVRLRTTWERALQDFEETDGPCRRKIRVPRKADDRATFRREFFPACVDRLRNCLLVIEELTVHCPTVVIKGTAMEDLILQGRHYGIRMLVTCQRLGRIPGEFHSEATEIVVYHTTRPRDRKILEEWGYENAWEDAPHLGVGECVILDS